MAAGKKMRKFEFTETSLDLSLDVDLCRDLDVSDESARDEEALELLPPTGRVDEDGLPQRHVHEAVGLKQT